MGELLDGGRRTPAPTRLLADDASASGDGEPTLSIVCGATNIARRPARAGGAARARCCRATGASRSTRIAGVESQGMLCSRRPSSACRHDADGILILPAGHAHRRRRSRTSSATWSSTSTSSPTAVTRCRILGLAREVAAATGATAPLAGHRAWRSRATPPRDHVARRASRTRPLPALRGPLPGRRHRRPVALRRPAAPHRRRRATHHQRRGRHQLRDARAGQAHPHLRRRRASRSGHIIVRARACRASASRPSTTSSASSTRTRCSSPTATGPLGIAGVMGGADERGPEATTRVVIESAIFDPVSIRRTAFRYALR